MKGRRFWALAGVASALVVAGCLFRTAEAPRFFRPASAVLDGDGDDIGVADDGAPVRLHTVRSAPFLRERVVWRVSAVEYGLYDQRRWFELPSRYVHRALVTKLRHTPGVRLGDDMTAPRLDVELLAFDEILAPQHEASVVLAVALRQGEKALLDRTYAAEVPIAGADGSAMAQAMGRALDEAVEKVAGGVAAELGKHAPSEPSHRTK